MSLDARTRLPQTGAFRDLDNSDLPVGLTSAMTGISCDWSLSVSARGHSLPKSHFYDRLNEDHFGLSVVYESRLTKYSGFLVLGAGSGS